MKKIFLLLLLLSLLLPIAADEGSKAITRSILLGYGTGHRVFRDDKTSLFLTGESVSGAVVVTGSVILVGSMFIAITYSPDPDTQAESQSLGISGMMLGGAISSIGSLSFLVFRIWEIVDIFYVVNDWKKGKVAIDTEKFSFTPEITINPEYKNQTTAGGNPFSPGLQAKISF